MTDDTPAKPAKAALRFALRERRRAFAAAHRAGLPAFAETMAVLVDSRCAGAGSLAGYVALPDEVDVLPALRRAHARGQATALPHVVARAEPMRMLGWWPGAPLEAGFFGLSQPDAGSPVLQPDIVLTPLLGFDRALARIGQGAGFYDGWFAAHPGAFRLGVAWSIQEVDALPTDRWDMPLHAVVTEREWIGAWP